MLISIQSGSVVVDIGPEKGYRMLREAGFEAIDWNLYWGDANVQAGKFSGCIFEESPEKVLAYYEKDLAEIRRNGLVITQAHAPFPSHVKGVPGVEEYSAEICKGCIRLCDAVGCKNLIIHGISCSYDEPEMTAEMVWEKNIALYSALIPVLQETNVTVCVENLFVGGNPVTEGTCCDPNEAVRMIDTLNEMAGKNCFALCLDTGHLNLLHKNVTNYIRTVGKRLAALHMHDNDGVSDQHFLPFSGKFRWKEFLAALKETGYDGDLSFEVKVQAVPAAEDPGYIPVILELIAGIGQVFREKLES
ncbi:MAG: sugar phosphate isomerase/epimerase [Clostridia bacterium]|nr:sugar phosphate isomerase/epimerase [Clostridia bacterium]